MNYKPNDLLNAIFSYLPDGYVVSDVTRKVVFTNKVIERITGWKANELIGKEVEKIFLLPESPTSKGNKEGVNIKSEAAILYCKNGKKIILPARQIEIKSSGNDKNKNEFTGCFTIFHVENNAGSDGHKVKEEFVSTVSHELRTPLTSIKGFADTLLRSGDKVTPENQKKYLTIIKEQADRLTRLVEDLLAVSRLESQNLQLTIRALDIRKAIDKVCDTLSTKSANHKIVLDIEENVPNVWADADRLEQILTNLIDNAIKYSPGGSTVTVKVISLLNEQNARDKLKIEVTDQGVGIKENDLPKIFSKFGRLDNPLTRQTQGTGLGLFITKSLVLSLKGEISVRSKSQETTFTVILPAVISNSAIPLSASKGLGTV